jgi:adenine-specific DNA-methyltransferase
MAGSHFSPFLPFIFQKNQWNVPVMAIAYETVIKTEGLVERADFYRLDANRKLNLKTKAIMGQFMTPALVARFMAALFKKQDLGEIRLLDAGAGIGSLTAAFVETICKRKARLSQVNTTTYELDPVLVEYLASILEECRQACRNAGVEFTSEIRQEDFIKAVSKLLGADLFQDASEKRCFTHAILNPPYKKINSNSEHRFLLRSMGIETGNLYTAFLGIVIMLLEPGGELVAITPRSFCNGPYYKPFRKLFLGNMTLQRIHVFESRRQAFKDDDVLQENIIFHAIKGAKQGPVSLSSSSGLDFAHMTIRKVNYGQLVNPKDPEFFIHIPTTELDQRVIDRMKVFNYTLKDLDINVCTGPVVDFRVRKYIRARPEPGTVPLIYPTHFKKNFIAWPKSDGRKPNAIINSASSRKWLMPNGYYTVVRRFSSKEEKRRVVAAVHDPANVPGEKIGFENHLNVFHAKQHGLNPDLAKGLTVYLNSTLLDVYFRQFNGHTQVNASDLRNLKYPSPEILQRLGTSVDSNHFPTQQEIDELLEKEIRLMAEINTPDPVKAKQKIDEALEILKALDFPRAQQNERSALTLLALLDVKPEIPWAEAQEPLIGITPIMDWCRDHYGRAYAPNTRETFRRQTMHQFVAAGLAVSNPDRPDRPVNSPKWCYQIEPAALELLKTYGTQEWEDNFKIYFENRESLRQRYAREREMQRIPVTVADGKQVNLTPGRHSTLIKMIIENFGPRYAPGGQVIYVGDTGDKWGYFDIEGLKNLGIEVDTHGKMPDVVIYYPEKKWLFLIEAVTSHGPVDGKRHDELSYLFKDSKAGLVYVTAFPTRAEMARYLSEISWETEVWVAEAPDHLIHFDGIRFMGPYDKG